MSLKCQTNPKTSVHEKLEDDVSTPFSLQGQQILRLILVLTEMKLKYIMKKMGQDAHFGPLVFSSSTYGQISQLKCQHGI